MRRKINPRVLWVRAIQDPASGGFEYEYGLLGWAWAVSAETFRRLLVAPIVAAAVTAAVTAAATSVVTVLVARHMDRAAADDVRESNARVQTLECRRGAGDLLLCHRRVDAPQNNVAGPNDIGGADLKAKSEGAAQPAAKASE